MFRKSKSTTSKNRVDVTRGSRVQTAKKSTKDFFSIDDQSHSSNLLNRKSSCLTLRRTHPRRSETWQRKKPLRRKQLRKLLRKQLRRQPRKQLKKLRRKKRRARSTNRVESWNELGTLEQSRVFLYLKSGKTGGLSPKNLKKLRLDTFFLQKRSNAFLVQLLKTPNQPINKIQGLLGIWTTQPGRQDRQIIGHNRNVT